MSNKKQTEKKAVTTKPLVSCTVIKHGAKVRSMICAKGKRLTLPADEVEALVSLGIVSAG